MAGIEIGKHGKPFVNSWSRGKEMPLEEVKCPDCDGEMVSRTGKFGVFWGCKSFPKCKGTRDSMGRSRADRAAERESKQEDEDRDIDRAQGRTTFRKGS